MTPRLRLALPAALIIAAGCTDTPVSPSGGGTPVVVDCTASTPVTLAPGEFAVLDPTTSAGACVRFPIASASGAEHLYVAVSSAGRETNTGVSTGYALGAAPVGVTLDQAWAAAELDELWQAEKWGEDYLAAERREARRAEFVAAARFVALSADQKA